MVWTVVDFEEHPELLSDALSGALRAAVCPRCQGRFPVNAMLLMHARDAFPSLVFSPADGSSDDEVRDQLRLTLRVMGHDGVVDVDEPPLMGPLRIAPSLLRRALHGDVAEDLAAYRRKPAPSAEEQLYERCLQDLRQRRLRISLKAVWELLPDAESFAGARRIVATRPELRSTEARRLVLDLARQATAEGQDSAARLNHELHDLLTRVAEIGVDAAFDQYDRDVRAGRRGGSALFAPGAGPPRPDHPRRT